MSFSLTKSDDIWTLHYEVGSLSRLLLIGAGIAGLGMGIYETVRPGQRMLVIVLPVLLGLGLMAYWLILDASTTVTFDLKQRRLDVTSRRPWFGPPRSYGFADVVGLNVASRSGESVDSWVAYLDLPDGSRIRLGEEAADRHERIRSYLQEIRHATGIGGA